MGRQVALLRGINLAGRNRIAMARLRELVEALGYEDVKTHLQSGNVVFTTDAKPARSAKRIEDSIAEELGLKISVLVRTRTELAGVVRRNPLGEVASDPRRLLVTFLSKPPDPKLLATVDPAEFEPDVFAAGKREIYMWCPNGVGVTKLSHAFWEKLLQVTATGRNWNTVTKLLDLLAV